MYKQKNITTTFFTPFFVVAKLIYFQSNYYSCTNVFLKLEEKKKNIVVLRFKMNVQVSTLGLFSINQFLFVQYQHFMIS